LEAARNRGLISGFPVTDFQATLLDGAYHEVDSSAATFQIAAHDCFGSLSRAHVALLEPIMQLEAEVPADAVDSAISDLKTRRAMTLRTRDRGSNKLLTALVPLSNLFGYENQVRGLTKGTGSSRMKFDHYAKVPPSWLDPDDTHPGAAIGLRSA
jgi:elongation factor G